VLDAGTGIGKSLGYLIPALRWSATNKERTVVSTNTINLQEQLVGKDLSSPTRSATSRFVMRCSKGGATISASTGSTRPLARTRRYSR
jgi:ATP-dependent DNA helicase DinG